MSIGAVSTTFVISGKAGQLGNRLFFSSHVMSLAHKVGARVVNLALSEYAGLFQCSAHDPLCRWPAQPHATATVPSWLREMLFHAGSLTDRALGRARRFAPGVHFARLDPGRSEEWRADNPVFIDALSRAKVVFFSGWLELHHLQIRGLNAVREYFALSSPHAESVRRLVSDARLRCDVLIGVHIRRGDYAQFLDGRYFYPAEAYWKMLHAMAALFPDRRVGFLVCSNERQTVPANFPHPVVFGSGIAVEDLYALAACDRLCGPPSTFSLWASFYGRKPLWEMKRADATPREEEFFVFQ